MQKAEAQHNHAQQPAQRQRKAINPPQSEHVQLEAMIDASPQVSQMKQLSAMMDYSPKLAAQRKAANAIHNSPHLAVQRQRIDSLTAETAQREEAEEPLQAKATQREEAPAKPNNTGLPDNLKSGIESLSGMSMDNVKVHYNSSQPAQLNALAYAQGTDIHVAPGQEQHLPHEVWHVVQQAQGRVQPTMQMKEGVPVNDDKSLEHEADVMGAKAASVGVAQGKSIEFEPIDFEKQNGGGRQNIGIIQAKKSAPFDLAKKNAARLGFNFSEYKGLRNEEYQIYIYNGLRKTYVEKAENGTRYWNNLQKVIEKSTGENKDDFINEQKQKRELYDQMFLGNYVSSANETDNSKEFDMGSSGLGNDKDVVNPEKDVPYTNKVSFEDNSIYANHNYAERDEARKSDEVHKRKGNKKRGLPNSEILWQQYKMAAQKYAGNEKGAQKLINNLNSVKRRQVQTADTLKTILFALPDGKDDLTQSHTWTPGTEEFLAMLGTDNCKGSAFLLTDHFDELSGKSIAEIKLLGGEDVNIDINFGKGSNAKKMGLIGGGLLGGAAYLFEALTLGPAVVVGLLSGLALWGGAKYLGY